MDYEAMQALDDAAAAQYEDSDEMPQRVYELDLIDEHGRRIGTSTIDGGTDSTDSFTVQVVAVRVTHEQIANLLCSAREGGSNHWARFRACPYQTATPWKVGGLLPLRLPVTVSEIISEEPREEKAHTLDMAAIQRGLSIMAAKYPHHFADVLGENDDAETADVLLQCALLGEIVYG